MLRVHHQHPLFSTSGSLLSTALIAILVATCALARDTLATPQRRIDTLCNSSSSGDPNITIGPGPSSLFEIIGSINQNKGTKIVLDAGVPALSVQISMTAPWQSILRMLMDQQNLGSLCYEDNIVLIKRLSDIAENAGQRRFSTPTVREIFKLHYLPIQVGPADLANQVDGPSHDSVQALEEAIRAIIRADGDPRSEIVPIAGSNEFLMSARPDLIEEVRRLVRELDRPRRQILVRVVLYSIKEKYLRPGSGYYLITGNPPLNYDTSSFLRELSSAQESGIVTVFARPVGVLLDGASIDLTAGSEIPITDQSLRFIRASRIVRVRPRVTETTDGAVDVVNVNVQVENNRVDTSTEKSRGLEAVDRQEIRTTLRLRNGQTAVFGGLSDRNKVVTRTPVLSSIPWLGQLFDRRKRETLFCALSVEVLPE